MRRFILRRCLRRIRASLICRMRGPRAFRYRRTIRRGQKHPRRGDFASRTFMRQFAFRHGPHRRKRSAVIAEIFVNWHRDPAQLKLIGGAPEGAPQQPCKAYLSGDMGMSTPPLTCFTGPAALGMMSNAKISVGSQSVAQALGISTTPDMWP